MKWASAVTVALLLALSACGDDDDSNDGAAIEASASSAAGDTGPEATVETDPPRETTQRDDVAVETTTVDGADDPWCAVAADLNDALTLSGAESGTPDGFETAFTELAEVIDTAQDAAPPEISDQVVALGEAIDSFIEAFAELDWDASAISDELGAELSEPIDEALEDITPFNEELCGLTSEAECNAMDQTLQVAIEAFIASEGRPPVDEQELIDAGFLREDIEGFDIEDGEVVVASTGGC